MPSGARWYVLLMLLVPSLLLSGCGQISIPPERQPLPSIPTSAPYPGPSPLAVEAYPGPPPSTSRRAPAPTPEGPVIIIYDLLTPRPVTVDITEPIYGSFCTPAAGEEEMAAIDALGLPDNIRFGLQRAIYLAREQDIPFRPAHVWITYDPAILTLTETIALLEEHGLTVTGSRPRSHYIMADTPLDVVPRLAAEPGIVQMDLKSLVYIDNPCPSLGPATAVPITPRPLGWIPTLTPTARPVNP